MSFSGGSYHVETIFFGLQYYTMLFIIPSRLYLISYFVYCVIVKFIKENTKHYQTSGNH